MTVATLSNTMDAVEFMEWIAFYSLMDKDVYEKLNNAVEDEKGAAYAAAKMREFLGSLKPTKKEQ